MNIRYGALAPKLIQQISVKEKYQEKIVQFFQEDADSITRLLVRGLLTQREADSARKKLHTEIENEFSGDKL